MYLYIIQLPFYSSSPTMHLYNDPTRLLALPYTYTIILLDF